MIPDAKDEQQINELTLKSFALFNWIGGGGLTWCAPVSPMRGADMQRQLDLAKSILPAAEARAAVQRFDERYCVVKHQNS